MPLGFLLGSQFDALALDMSLIEAAIQLVSQSYLAVFCSVRAPWWVSSAMSTDAPVREMSSSFEFKKKIKLFNYFKFTEFLKIYLKKYL